MHAYPSPERVSFDVELRGDPGDSTVGGIRVALGVQDELDCTHLDVVSAFLGHTFILLEWGLYASTKPGAIHYTFIPEEPLY